MVELTDYGILLYLYRYKYLLEFGVILFLAVCHLPKRRAFLLRLLVAAVAAVALSSIWTREMASIPWMKTVRYTLLFIIGVFAVWCCMNISFTVALFCGTFASAMQRIMVQTEAALEAWLHVQTAAVSIVIYILCLLPILLFSFLFAKKYIAEKNRKYMENPLILTAVLLILLVNTVMGLGLHYISEPVPQPADQVIRIYEIICSSFTIWLLFSIFQFNQVRQELLIVQQLWKREETQYRLSRETHEMLNIKCHDLKHLLRHMDTSAAMRKERESIQELVEVYDSQIDTGNATLNLILAEKGMLCRKNGIRLNSMADGKILSFMKEPDVYYLFGNALDNAIEAVIKLPNSDQRVITLTVRETMAMAEIRVENYYDGVITMQNGIPVTDKNDFDNHGFGIRSMKLTVEKYSGTMHVENSEGIFVLSCLIPCA